MSAHGLAQNWWLIVLRGLSAVLFGLAAWVWPNSALVVLVLFAGLYLFTDGAFAVITGLNRRQGSQFWWLSILEGALGIFAATLALLVPRLTALALLYVIAAWAILTGMVAIVAAIRLRKDIADEGLLALGGVLSAMLGMILMIWPGTVALTAVWFIGGYALASGLLLIGLGFRLWNWQNSTRLAAQPVRVSGERNLHTLGRK